jgi:hypothetical protein
MAALTPFDSPATTITFPINSLIESSYGELSCGPGTDAKSTQEVRVGCNIPTYQWLDIFSRPTGFQLLSNAGNTDFKNRPPIKSLGPCDTVNNDMFVITILGSVSRSLLIPSCTFASMPVVQPLHPI